MIRKVLTYYAEGLDEFLSLKRKNGIKKDKI